MAIVRKTLKQVHAAALKADKSKLRVPGDREIARQIAEDPDTAPFVTIDMLIAPQNLRRQLGMMQEAFAAALGIPVATLRNWEQGRNAIDPAVRALLVLVARDPKGAVRAVAIQSHKHKPYREPLDRHAAARRAMTTSFSGGWTARRNDS